MADTTGITWDSFISFGGQLLTLTALVGVTWSAIEFVRSAVTARSEKRAEQVAQWRKASVHKIVANSYDFLTVDQITSTLRSESFEAPIDIKKSELTVEAVRRLIMDLVTERVLCQVWPDKYGIQQVQFDVTRPVAEAGVKGNLALRGAFASIHKHPGRYSDEELYSERDTKLDLSLPDFILALSELEARKVAKKTPDGKWTPISKSTGNN